MARVSNTKVINDIEKYNRLHPKYIEVLDRLIAQYPTINGATYGHLVNFQSNKEIAKHRWLDYKQGYADGLVRSILQYDNIGIGSLVLDPFCGVGTTNLTAQSMGLKSIGLDINPIAILTAEVKTHYYTTREISQIENILFCINIPQEEYHISDVKVLVNSFTPKIYSEFMRLRMFVERIEDSYVQKFFRLCLISIIDHCSLKVKDGNGLKIRKNPPQIDSAIDVYKQKALMMLNDIKNFNQNVEAKIIFGSSLSQQTYAGVRDVDICVFSPPYANCFDYCEVYKLELWIGGFVRNYADFERFRSIAMRSHVNSKFDHYFTNEFEDVDIIAETIRTFNIWNKNIPDMLKGYFDDTQKVLENVRDTLKIGAKCYVVVANSAYKGIVVPTDLLIANIAERIGYKAIRIVEARTIRSSSQQMHAFGDKYNGLMRESIVELQKL